MSMTDTQAQRRLMLRETASPYVSALVAQLPADHQPNREAQHHCPRTWI